MLASNKNIRSILSGMLFLFFILASVLFCYSQYLKKEIIAAILQYQLNLERPSDLIYAISTSDQKLSTGKDIPRGTKFIGMLNKEEKGFVIYFDTIQTVGGDKEKVLAKSIVVSKEKLQDHGVSAKIGMTLYNRTQSNVLGAIFKSSAIGQNTNNQIIPQGSTIKIEID